MLFCCKHRISILVVATFKIHYIKSLLSKSILIVLSGDSVIIRNQNTGYHWSATKRKICKRSVECAKSAK